MNISDSFCRVLSFNPSFFKIFKLNPGFLNSITMKSHSMPHAWEDLIGSFHSSLKELHFKWFSWEKNHHEVLQSCSVSLVELPRPLVSRKIISCDWVVSNDNISSDTYISPKMFSLFYPVHLIEESVFMRSSLERVPLQVCF